ncbi:MAG TPA: hypothetical protein VFC99_03040, partial [Acidimicrobiia bacterium]|nr:hypothetical protein [Acidimicrobiia bacterium]
MALVAAGAGLALAQTDPASTLALTVSGQDAQPYAIRGALADASSGPGIRFRAPVSADLTAVHLAWRRPGSDCTVTLQEDAGGNPGTVLDVAAVPTDATWVSAPLAGHLDAGAEYHLVVTCTTARGRLAYTLDRADVGAPDRSWALEFVRDDGQANERRAPTTPLFLLAFADGSSWGQPYAPWGGRLTVCGPNEITTTIVPAETTDVHGVDLPARTIGRTTAVEYTISANPDGPAILAGVADATDDVPAAELPNPVELQAGVPYTVRLRAPDLVAGCLQVPGLVSGFPIGAAATGVRTQHVGNSIDGGQTWTAQPLAAVSAHVRVQRRRPRTTTTTTTRPPATSTSTTSTSSTTVTSTTTSTTTTLAPATTTTTPPPTTTVTTTVTTTTVPTTTRPPATTTTTSTTTSTLPPPTTTTTTTTT